MEDLGDYIYIIVLAVVGLSSLLRKKKKAAEGTEVLSDFPDLPDLDDVIPEYTRYDTPSKPVPPPPPAHPLQRVDLKKERMASVMTYENTTDFTKLRSRNTFQDHHSKKVEIIELEEEETLDVSFETTDDAKRAFVYSEIFNRKY